MQIIDRKIAEKAKKWAPSATDAHACRPRGLPWEELHAKQGCAGADMRGPQFQEHSLACWDVSAYWRIAVADRQFLPLNIGLRRRKTGTRSTAVAIASVEVEQVK